ncbi:MULTISPECIES: spore germination protein [Paenibacillus]|uniref:spore germination protein n=1 Tax=Paenibacillus TaxID=44249 RepID=UPI0006D55557|nr:MULTISPECIES: spore germination protein [Paenibacillus]KPV56209.1 hypothetical protein QJ48_29000 [Paenibacillus sp. A3]MBU7317812.1 spore germination protein [Paenibacillus oleatilyticus]MCP1309899.1 spore germination protein [Paenibacillus tyrfis]
MTTPAINIFYIKINSISNNGSFSIGDTFHHGHTVRSKTQGTNASFGDESPPRSEMRNIYIDPDLNDQGELTLSSK